MREYKQIDATMKVWYSIICLFCVFMICVSDVIAQPSSPQDVATRRFDLEYIDFMKSPDKPTGKDLIIMSEHQLFYADFSSTLEHTNNAFLSSHDREDYLHVHSVSAGFRSMIDEKYEVRAGFNTSMARYSRYQELDYDMFGGVFEIAIPDDQSRYGIRYTPRMIYERRFSGRELSIHELSMFYDAQSVLDERTVMFCGIRGGRSFSNPDDYELYSVTADLGMMFVLKKDLFLSFGVSGQYQDYDNYFESLTGEDRRDLKLTPFASLRYSPSDWFEVSLLLRHTYSDSTLSSLDYDATAISPAISVNIEF